MGAYDLTLGTLLIGIFFNTYLYGLVTYQFVVYYRSKFNDRLGTKCTVLFLFILDTFHSTAVIYLAWYHAVKNYDNPVALQANLWPYPLTPIATALTALITQMYLGHRIWRFTDNKVLFGVVIILAIPSFILGFLCSVEAWVRAKLPRITALVIAWSTTQTIVDAFITSTLVTVFARSQTGFRRTDTVLNRLIRGAIQTGLFVGLFSMGDLFSFIFLPRANLYGMFAIPIGRIYTNTFMDSILSRESLRAELCRSYDVSDMLDQIRWTDPNAPRGAPKLESNNSDSVQLEGQVPVQETDGPSSRGSTKGKAAPLEV